MFRRYQSSFGNEEDNGSFAATAVADVEAACDVARRATVRSRRMSSNATEEDSAARMRKLRMSHAVRDAEPSLTRGRVFALMHELGFELDEHTFGELFEEVDSLGEGTVTRVELITMLGMLKQNILEVMELEKAFTRLREARTLAGAGTE